MLSPSFAPAGASSAEPSRGRFVPRGCLWGRVFGGGEEEGARGRKKGREHERRIDWSLKKNKCLPTVDFDCSVALLNVPRMRRSFCGIIGIRIHIAACPSDGEKKNERRGKEAFLSPFALSKRTERRGRRRGVRARHRYFFFFFHFSLCSYASRPPSKRRDDGRPRGQQLHSVVATRGSPGSPPVARSWRQRHAPKSENLRRRRHLRRPRVAAHRPRRRVQQPGGWEGDVARSLLR